MSNLTIRQCTDCARVVDDLSTHRCRSTADLHHIATVATAAYLGGHPAGGRVEDDGVAYYVVGPVSCGDSWGLYRAHDDAIVATFDVDRHDDGGFARPSPWEET